MSNLLLGQDISSDVQVPPGTIYEDKAIWLSAFIGGPLVSGYIIAENFEAFDEHDKAVATRVITVVSTICIFAVSFLIPVSLFSQKALAGISSAVAYMLIRYHQGERVGSTSRGLPPF